jgi:hypothetical protein
MNKFTSQIYITNKKFTGNKFTNSHPRSPPPPGAAPRRWKKKERMLEKKRG